MQNLISSIIFSVITVFSFSAFSMSHSELVLICYDRVKSLENELINVLSTKKYPRSMANKVKKSMSSNDINIKVYKNRIESLKSILELDDLHVDAVDCLLKTSDLLIKLDNIAKAGGKDLNDFSRFWKDYFPGQARKLQYVN